MMKKSTSNALSKLAEDYGSSDSDDCVIVREVRQRPRRIFYRIVRRNNPLQIRERAAQSLRRRLSFYDMPRLMPVDPLMPLLLPEIAPSLSRLFETPKKSRRAEDFISRWAKRRCEEISVSGIPSTQDGVNLSNEAVHGDSLDVTVDTLVTQDSSKPQEIATEENIVNVGPTDPQSQSENVVEGFEANGGLDDLLVQNGSASPQQDLNVLGEGKIVQSEKDPSAEESAIEPVPMPEVKRRGCVVPSHISVPASLEREDHKAWIREHIHSLSVSFGVDEKAIYQFTSRLIGSSVEFDHVYRGMRGILGLGGDVFRRGESGLAHVKLLRRLKTKGFLQKTKRGRLCLSVARDYALGGSLVVIDPEVYISRHMYMHQSDRKPKLTEILNDPIDADALVANALVVYAFHNCERCSSRLIEKPIVRLLWATQLAVAIVLRFGDAKTRTSILQ